MNALDSQLFAMTGDSFGTLRTQLWNTVDEEISLADCDIYRYIYKPHIYLYIRARWHRPKGLLVFTVLLHEMKTNKKESVLTYWHTRNLSFIIKLSIWLPVYVNFIDCSYNPDLNSDPYGEEGCLWSFNYFFYNKKMKRIVFFTCRASRLANVEWIAFCVGVTQRWKCETLNFKILFARNFLC